MSEFLTDFYHVPTGVVFTLRWSDEQEYSNAKAFLNELVGPAGSCGLNEPGKVPSYYLENEQQYDALLDFRKKLRQARKSA
jgi:hypothetical protein